MKRWNDKMRDFRADKIEEYYQEVANERKAILTNVRKVRGIGKIRHGIIEKAFDSKKDARDFHVPMVTKLTSSDITKKYIKEHAIRNERKRFVLMMDSFKFINERMSTEMLEHIYGDKNKSNERGTTDVSTFRSSKFRIG